MSSNDYFAHATRQTSEAAKAEAQWLKTLTPEQRKALSLIDDHDRVGGHAPSQTTDAAESTLARVEPDMTLLDDQASILADEFHIPLETAKLISAWHTAEVETQHRAREADLLSVVVAGLLSAKNIRIATAGLAFATDMAATNGFGTPAEYARSLGVSRTILSKAVKNWQRSLGLRAGAFQKSDDACEKYSSIAKAKHWRKAKVSAADLMKRIQNMRKKSK